MDCYDAIPVAVRYMPKIHSSYGFSKGSLLRAIITQESQGNPKAQSETGAKGCMQMTTVALEDVARTRGIPWTTFWNKWDADWRDPILNSSVGASFLAILLDRAEQQNGTLFTAVKNYYGCDVSRLPGHPTSCEQYAQTVFDQARKYQKQSRLRVANNGE